ncbi:hypothetical protein GCM10009678_66670 [Actinomadura kijaniata]
MGAPARMLGRVNHVPFLWSVAYGPRHSAPTRFLARRALGTAAFVRALARADHRSFTVL